MRSVLALMLVFIAGETCASDAYEVVGTSLKVGDSKICLLDKKPRYAIESFDGSAVILSETDYVDKRRLDKVELGGCSRAIDSIECWCARGYKYIKGGVCFA